MGRIPSVIGCRMDETYDTNYDLRRVVLVAGTKRDQISDPE